jgi:hypothetical protein
VRGFDREGHAVVYLRPKAENTHDHDGNLRHLVFNLEKAIAAMRGNDPDGVQKLVLLIDYNGYTLSNAPPMKTSLATLSILQNHYPERLFRAYCINPPWVFNAFYNMVYPFIDPVTKAKIAMVNGTTPKSLQDKLKANFDLDNVETSVGGRDTRPFDSRVYVAAPFAVDFLTAITSPQKETADLAVKSVPGLRQEAGPESKEEEAVIPERVEAAPKSKSSYFFTPISRRPLTSKSSHLDNLPPAGVHVLVARNTNKPKPLLKK